MFVGELSNITEVTEVTFIGEPSNITEEHKPHTFVGEPRNITEVTFVEEPRNIRFFIYFFCLFCLPPRLRSLQNRHKETAAYTYTIYNNPISHVIERVITHVKHHNYPTQQVSSVHYRDT
jgi:hypothetical protein